MIKVFISHTHKDKELVQELKLKIEEKFKDLVSLAISSDNQDGPSAGEKWKNWIVEKIKSSDVMIFVITRNTKDSNWMNFESGMAVGNNKDIIPIVLDDQYEIPPTLIEYNAITKDRGDKEARFNTLLKHLDNLIKNKRNSPINILIPFLFGPIGVLIKNAIDDLRKNKK